MVNVPAAYQPLVNQIASQTGLPSSVVAAQANAESGFNATAVSSAGAEGWLQFLPSTYDSVAAQAGVSPGTEFNPSDEAKAYVVFMKQLLGQENGNIRNALAAYNAGPGNISAGYGYADSILSAAGEPTNSTASGTGSSSSTTGGTTNTATTDSAVSSIFTDAINAVLSALGLGSLKDLFQRLGLILLGATLLIVGIHMLATGGSKSQPFNITVDDNKATGTRTQNVKTPVGSRRSVTRTGEGRAAGEAIEAAAVA